MNSSDERIERIKELIIDSEFESVCSPLTDDEFTQLEENILSDGEVTDPLVVWNNILIDGHHRRQIILKHPELPFTIRDVVFNNRYDAIVWICKNQAGRRNLAPDQVTYLLGKRYAAEKHTNGATDGFRGNRYVLVVDQNDQLLKPESTCARIAKEYGLGEATVRRAEQFSNGVDAAEAACPGVKQELLSGSLKTTRKEVSSLSKLPAEKVAERISEYRKAQEELEEKKRKIREEKRRKADETGIIETENSSLSELSARMAEPKPRNNVSNVIGIISSKAEEMQEICEFYIDEFPELLLKDFPQLDGAVTELREYLIGLHDNPSRDDSDDKKDSSKNPI